MTGLFWLDWAILAVSLFNTITLLWLGLTVLFNADRHSRGVWLLGGGLLAAGLFFISHTAILGQELTVNVDGLNFWWRVGWIPVTVAPFAWYVVVLWYAGFWAQPMTKLYRRHLPWLLVIMIVGVGLVGSLALTNALPAYEQIVQLDLSKTLTIRGIPLALLGFPVFMVSCIVLSIDALLHPAPTEQPIREQARQRSRPWLLGTASVLLVVSLLVTTFIAYIVRANQETILALTGIQAIGLFDLILAGLIAVSIILLGQAIVAYEVFTGRVLPRREFFRHWRSLLILAAGYAVVVGWTLAFQLRPIYSLLLTTLLMIVFYALFSWRAFMAREQFMTHLRPFVTSERIVAGLVGADDESSKSQRLFETVCREVLGTVKAQLIPLGAFAPLAGPALMYPTATSVTPFLRLPNLDAGIVALNPEHDGGYHWAIPLWAERGLSGVLLVGAKHDHSLYAQEEIEIARASGERIVDTLAGEQIARRLMQMQRTRMTETRVMDLQTRRALHDEVLPLLHTLVLQMRNQPGETVQALTDLHRRIADLITSAQPTPTLYSASDGLAASFRRIVEAEFSRVFENLTWQVSDVPEVQSLAGEVMLGAARELLRNAALHGRGRDPHRALHVTLTLHCTDTIEITISDDGVGAVLPADNHGGLALHSTLMAVIGGTLTLDVDCGTGTKASLILPLPNAAQA